MEKIVLFEIVFQIDIQLNNLKTRRTNLSKIIDEIWIIKKEGLVLFSRITDTEVAKELVGSFFSALNTFADELIKGNLTSVDLLSKTFFIKKLNEIVLIATSSHKEKNVNEALDKIGSRFISRYSQVLKHWNHDTNEFIEFENDLKDFLKSPVDRFLAAL